MRTYRTWLSIGPLACLVLTSTVAGAPGQESSGQVDEILSEIQLALVRVQNEAASKSLPKLASVSLDLETELSYGGGGELNLYVVSVDGKVDREKLQRIKLNLVPPKPKTEEPIGKGGISEDLSSAILVAAQGVANAQNRKPPLVLDKLEAEIRFILKKAAEGGVKFQILPITAGLQADIKNSAIQTITVSFEEKSK
jgi:hypothetical protein